MASDSWNRHADRLVLFVSAGPRCKVGGEAPHPAQLAAHAWGMPREWLIYGLGLAGVAAIWLLIQYQEVAGTLLMVVGRALLGYVVLAALRLDKHARERIFAVPLLILNETGVVALCEQAGGSLNLSRTPMSTAPGCPRRCSSRSTQSTSSCSARCVFRVGWTRIGRRGLEPSTPVKFGLAIIQGGLAFQLLVWGSQAVGNGGRGPGGLHLLFYLLQDDGRAVHLAGRASAMNRLAPRHMASLIMGAWFSSPRPGGSSSPG